MWVPGYILRWLIFPVSNQAQHTVPMVIEKLSQVVIEENGSLSQSFVQQPTNAHCWHYSYKLAKLGSLLLVNSLWQTYLKRRQILALCKRWTHITVMAAASLIQKQWLLTQTPSLKVLPVPRNQNINKTQTLKQCHPFFSATNNLLAISILSQLHWLTIHFRMNEWITSGGLAQR